MTWTYDPADLATNEVDALRLEIGDTDIQYQLLQNEEIAWNITQERNYWSAAARCCEQISRLFVRKADVKLGRSMSVQYTRMADQYTQLASRLRKKGLGTVPPYAGGALMADKMTIGNNSAIVAPLFTKTMMENPWTGGYTTDSLPPVPSGNDVIPQISEEG